MTIDGCMGIWPRIPREVRKQSEQGDGDDKYGHRRQRGKRENVGIATKLTSKYSGNDPEFAR